MLSSTEFLGFWVFQMFWVWTVSLPVTVLNSPNVTKYGQPDFGTGRDIAGVILYSIGLFMESWSDIQKYRFRSKHQNDGAVCNVGLFMYTRHPNYFGESTLWTGIATTAAGVLVSNVGQSGMGLSGSATARVGALAMAAVSPAFVTFLLFKVRLLGERH